MAAQNFAWLRHAILGLMLIGLGACSGQRGLVREHASGPRGSGSRVLRAEVARVRDELAPLIAAAEERFGIPGMSVVLVRGDRLLWAEGFGYADKAAHVPASADTVYRAGSLAKPLTAMAVMQLEEHGDIDIDQPLNGYLPEFSIRSRFDTTARPITVRSVLSHHAGLPSDLEKGMWSNEPFTEVALRLKDEYTAYPPNLVFSYSNVGYTLLGQMVAEVSGEGYGEYVRRHIFAPLGMVHSHMGAAADPLLARGYRDGAEARLLPMRDTPALGLYTSAADLGRFMEMILGGGNLDGREVIGRGSLERMFECQNADVPLDMDVHDGLGWFLEDGTIPGAGRVIRHSGTTLLYGAEMILLPEQGLGVAVLANGNGATPVAAKLGEAILVRVLATLPRPASPARFVAALAQEATRPVPVQVAGRYATDLGLISIRPKDGDLCACLVERNFDLLAYPDGWFGIAQRPPSEVPEPVRPLAAMRFRAERIGGRDVIVGKLHGKRMVLGEKVPAGPLPQSWLDRVGRYRLVNPDPRFPVTDARLSLHDGQLCMSYRKPLLSPDLIRLPIRPISDTQAIILGLGRNRGETLQAVTVDGEERLRYSGLEGRKVR